MASTWLLAEINPTWMLLAGIAVLTSVMVRLTYRRSRQRPSRARPAASQPTSAVHNPTYHDLVRRLEEKEVEFDELSRTALARLDNKIAILQRLLAESDQTIARLQEARQNSPP